jgi:hypothetical protein
MFRSLRRLQSHWQRVNRRYLFSVGMVGVAADLEPRSAGMLRASYGEGGRLVVLEPNGSRRVLTSDFASACDPDVSFDGERVLFAGQKQAGDPWNIWEIESDGNGARQITYQARNSRSPVYLSSFYTITSSEPWFTLLFVQEDAALNEEGSARASSLYTVRLDGSELRRITFNPSNEMDPYLMPDGLLLFAGWQRQSRDRWPSGRVSLFGVQTDGIDYSLFGGSQGSRIQHMPTVSSQGVVAFVEADSVAWDGAGHLAAVSQQRPHHSYRRLTDDAAGLFHSPSPLDDGALLVSRRPADGGGDHGLFRYSPADGSLEPIYDAPGSHEIHARALRPRAQPDGRSSTVRPESPTGKLYGLDVYQADARLAAHLEPGSIRRLRVIEGLPPHEQTVKRAAELDIKLDQSPLLLGRRLLGEVPVAEDGSFHFDLPADLPVQLQALDGNGMALATCDWIWVKQREYRGCIGCHEDPELTPENRFVQAVGRPAQQLTLPPERRRTVTFRGQVEPILARRCAGCHGSGGGNLQLVDEAAGDGGKFTYAQLMSGSSATGRYVEPGRARNSYLIWLLFGRDTSRPWDRGGASPRRVPANHADLLSESERRTFVEWVDLGAQWDVSLWPDASFSQGERP